MELNNLPDLATALIDGKVDGFTVNVVFGMTPMTEGFSVGGNPEVPEVRLKDVRNMHHGLLADALEFYARNVRIFGEAIMGGWVHEGDLYLDAPTIYFDGEEAERVSRERKQLAYFDLDTMTEHTVDA